MVTRGRMVGAARAEITPPVGIFSGMWGAADWDRTSGVHRPLTMTALWIGGNDGPELLLISMDLGAWRLTADEWEVRRAVLEASGLPADNVILHLVHTHAGPSICSADVSRPGGELIPEYLSSLRTTAVRVAEQARAAAVPAKISWSMGHSDLATCRDLPLEGRYVVGWNPSATADGTVAVGRIVADGRVTATILHYGCHPTSLAWGNQLLSPDYVGAAREVVEAGTDGAPCLFLYGAGGDQAPREQYSGDSALADRNGAGLGHAALAVMEMMDSEAEPAASTARAVGGTVRLPLKSARSLPQLAKRFWPTLDERTRQERIRRAQWRLDNAGSGEHCDYPLWVWWVDGAVLAAQPGEAYSALAVELRHRFPDLPILAVSLANGPVWTYLPRRELFESNVYQVWHTPFRAGCHEAVRDEFGALIMASNPAGGSHERR